MTSPTLPFIVTETGHALYAEWDEETVVSYALEYAREHGPYSGMEDWDEESMSEWIRRELNETGNLDLHISGPAGREFRVQHSGSI